jgi:hypothetical protein
VDRLGNNWPPTILKKKLAANRPNNTSAWSHLLAATTNLQEVTIQRPHLLQKIRKIQNMCAPSSYVTKLREKT